MRNLSRVLEFWEPSKLLDLVDQELPEITGQHVLCFVAPITDVGHQNLALESSAGCIFSASEFLPVMLNFDKRV